MLGPNNGITVLNPGEIVTFLGKPIDQDFDDLVFPTTNPGGGDATVLEFEVDISQPGFLRVSFVFGSDEHPFYVNPDGSGVNDSVGIIIDGEHIDPENIATTTVNGVTTPFDFFEFVSCDLPMFFSNDVAPSPAELVGSAHAIPSAPLYDIEFGGFTKKLTREISCPLAPGRYTVKFVVQDVGDQQVDAAVFIETASLKLFALANGDYNGDGIVDAADFDVWDTNFGMTPAKFYDGDGNGDGVVDAADYTIWYDNFNETGNPDLKGDANRDGCISQGDLDLVLLNWGVLKCASRFEGDVNGDTNGPPDGKVSQADYDEVLLHWGDGNCPGSMASFDQETLEAQLTAAGISADLDAIVKQREELALAQESTPLVDKSDLPPTPDANGDGHVDAADFAIIEGILYGLTADDGPDPAASAELITTPDDSAPIIAPEPTPAEVPMQAPEGPPTDVVPPFGPRPDRAQLPPTPRS